MKIRNDSKLVPRAVVVTTSLPTDNMAGEIILKKFLSLLSTAFKDICVITSGMNNQLEGLPEWIHVMGTDYNERSGRNLIGKLKRHLLSQSKMVSHLIKIDIHNIPTFFWNANILVLPNAYSRYRGALNFFFQFGECSIAPRSKYPGIKGQILSLIIKLFERINLQIAKYVAIENKSIIETNRGISKYTGKLVEISLFVNTFKFERRIAISSRQVDVIYLGRLGAEKGIINLIEALKLLSASNHIKLKFLIVGNGYLKDYVKQSIKNIDWVNFMGWVDHDKLPSLLNSSKCLIIPSDTEGLPNVVIEAMACGTIPIATPVGGIPGVVMHGKTGFLLKNNSPESIRKGIEEALQNPGLQAISERASIFVQENYSFSAASDRLRQNLAKVGILK